MQSFLMPCLGSIRMDPVISECNGHFPIIPLSNSMVKKFGNHNMAMLYTNPCDNKVCYKGTAF